MVAVVEIALAVYGLFGLFTGALIISKSKVVRGYRARLLAILALAPVAAAFTLLFTFSGDANRFAAIEGVVTGVVAVLVFGIGTLVGENRNADAGASE